jgi:selenocysteine lyase/cysteine desulfurase
MRVLSNLPNRIRVLTTDGEFHSFARQLARFEEAGRAEVVRVPTRPFETFAARWGEAAKGTFDLCYISHVFFDSGYALRDLGPIVAAAPRDAIVIVDGYHAFCAIDVDLSRLAERIFYVGGGYKYAMSGEGCCFLHAPPGVFPRPIDTGWFASFFTLKDTQKGVSYPEDASRFLGATYDPTPLYRLDAVMSMLEQEGITTREIDERAKTLQRLFVEKLGAEHPLGRLVVPVSDPNRGQFLVFESPKAKELHEDLAARDVMTDVRGDRLRFGFGIYHDESDVMEAVRRIAAMG